MAIAKGQTRRPGAQSRCFGDPAEEKKQPRNSSLSDRSKANSRRPQGMRRILPATKVRHARAQHAAQSAKQPPDLCFLLQAPGNKLRPQACFLGCRMRLGNAQHRQRARGFDNRLSRRPKGAAATSSARTQHAASSQMIAGVAGHIIRAPHDPRPAAGHLCDHASTRLASGSASNSRAPSFSCFARQLKRYTGNRAAHGHAFTDTLQDFAAASLTRHPASSIHLVRCRPCARTR